MGNRRDDKYNDKRCKEPVDDELDERKLKNVEAYINVELGIFDSEILPIAEENPVLPAASRTYPEEKSK